MSGAADLAERFAGAWADLVDAERKIREASARLESLRREFFEEDGCPFTLGPRYSDSQLDEICGFALAVGIEMAQAALDRSSAARVIPEAWCGESFKATNGATYLCDQPFGHEGPHVNTSVGSY